MARIFDGGADMPSVDRKFVEAMQHSSDIAGIALYGVFCGIFTPAVKDEDSPGSLIEMPPATLTDLVRSGKNTRFPTFVNIEGTPAGYYYSVELMDLAKSYLENRRGAIG